MGADPNAAPVSPKQRRRQTLRYFGATGTQRAIRDAISETAPSLTVFDTERIVTLLAERLDSYSGPPDRFEFRAWAVSWAARAALLTAVAKPMLPELAEFVRTIPGLPLTEAGLVAGRLLNKLHEYPGHAEDLPEFRAWAKSWVLWETQCVLELARWIDEHRSAVNRGLWSVLSECSDLGANELTADELQCDVWRWVAGHVPELLQPGAPLPIRLCQRARFVARAWRTERLRERAISAELEQADREAVARLNGGWKLPMPVAA